MLYNSKKKFHFLLASIWKPRMSKSDPEPANALYAKTKTQISFAVTAKLISVFVIGTRIVQSLCFLNPKFQVSSHLLWLNSPVCAGPGLKPRRPVFLRRGSFGSDNVIACLLYF